MMEIAIGLSRNGFPAPNPHVGCVIVKDNIVVGKGFHLQAGGDHAEVAAIRDAGVHTVGATAYVTLEPCNHTGRTPPCTQALIEAGIKKVFIGSNDPNPIASGGAQELMFKGIEVINGISKNECILANERWYRAFEMGRPFVTVKMAVSLDGRVANPDCRSGWITGIESRTNAHRLRAQHSAILTGRKSIEMDDSELTVRHIESAHQPLKIVIDPSGKLTDDYKVFDQSVSECLRLVGHNCLNPLENDKIMSLDANNKISPKAILDHLWEIGKTSVLIEGGPATARSFFEFGLVDAIELYIAPIIIGAGLHWITNGTELQQQFTIVNSELLGMDQHISLSKKI